MSQICENCGREIPAEAQVYTMRIDLFAQADPPDFDAADLDADSAEELQDLVREMEEMDDLEVREAEAQVYESYLFSICPGCRLHFHEQLRARAPSEPEW